MKFDYIAKWIIFIAGLFILMPSNAQTVESSLSLRSFDSVQIHNLSKKSEFIYQKKKGPSVISSLYNRIVSKFLKWLLKKGIKITTDEKSSGYILFSIIFIFAIIVAYFLIKSLGFFNRISSEDQLRFEEENDNNSIDQFQELIANALRENNFRLAVRIHYLALLKLLDTNEFIIWSKDKTNTDYSYELKSTSFHTDFVNLSRSFDYIWYGELAISSNQYVLIKHQFEELESKVKGKQ